MFSSKEGKPGTHRGWFKPQQESSPSSHRGPYTTHTHRQHSDNCTSASLGAGHSHTYTRLPLREALKRQGGGVCLAAAGSPTPAASVLDGGARFPCRQERRASLPPGKDGFSQRSAILRRDYADFPHEGMSHAPRHVEACACQAGGGSARSQRVMGGQPPPHAGVGAGGGGTVGGT